MQTTLMQYKNQSGFSLVSAVMLLMAFGLLIFSSLNEQLAKYQLLANEEHRYLQIRNQVLSSLNWGLSLQWPKPDDTWFCQNHPSLKLNACLKNSLHKDYAILKGYDAEQLETSNISLFYLVQTKPLSLTVSHANAQYQLNKVNSGWLDYCPVAGKLC